MEMETSGSYSLSSLVLFSCALVLSHDFFLILRFLEGVYIRKSLGGRPRKYSCDAERKAAYAKLRKEKKAWNNKARADRRIVMTPDERKLMKRENKRREREERRRKEREKDRKKKKK